MSFLGFLGKLIGLVMMVMAWCLGILCGLGIAFLLWEIMAFLFGAI